MKCKLCNSENVIFIKHFKPYIDKDWCFEMYDCKDCGARFCIRDNNINYHEEIHSSLYSPYQFHYIIAKEVKKKLQNLDECEKYLTKRSPIFKKVMKYLNSQPKELNILEIGCSTGYVTAFLQKKGFKNTLGIDISKSAISYAKKEFGNFYALKEKKNKKYDVIFHSGLIGCVDHPMKFLEHYLALLTENGVMFFNAPDVDSVRERGIVWVSTPPPDLIYLFKADFLIKTFSLKYDVYIEKTLSPLKVLLENIKKYKRVDSENYPKKFISDKLVSAHNENIFKKIVKFVISIIALFLLKIKVLRNYSDEYGLLCTIRKK